MLGTFSFCGLLRAQEEDDKEIPREQIPIEQRDHGDSFVENLGELPGDIVTLPFKVFFKGVSTLARVMDYNRIVLRVGDFLTSEDEKRKVRPLFAPFSGAGVLFSQNDLGKPGLNFRASAAFGVRTRHELVAGFRDVSLLGRGIGVELVGTRSRLPDEDFFGFGNQSLRTNETNYLYEESKIELGLAAQPFQHAIVAAGFRYSNVGIGEGRDVTPTLVDVFSPGEVPGFFGAEMGAAFIRYYRDTRNQTGHPSAGGEELFTVDFVTDIESSDFGFRKVTLDLRRYVNLFYRRVLVLRVRSEITDSPSDRQVPFYRLAGLGGQDNLRGYRPVRFRDNDMLLASVEYRWKVHNQASTFIFLDEGRVFSDLFDEFTFKDFKYSYGFGLRLLAPDGGLTAVFELARSQEQTRFTFGLNTELKKF